MSFQVVYSDEVMPAALHGAVAALGNFDGFHKGHQAVARAAIDKARFEGRPALIATFDPHPARLFQPDLSPFRLTTLEQRADLFAEAGADAMLVFRFTRELAALSPEAFVGDLLAGQLKLNGVVTGQDFTFGARRAGNIHVLSTLGELHGISSEAIGEVLDGERIVSSTRIREALQSGRPEEAARLLTRPYTIMGRVEHGDKNGRKLGFPTANVDMGSYLRPKYGIYAVRGILPDGRVLNGAANLGIRPSFDPPKELLEPHFFDFDGDLYGQDIAIELRHFLRPEAKFDSMDALMSQMAKDCDEARRLLAL